jgi:hypothetical protein
VVVLLKNHLAVLEILQTHPRLKVTMAAAML